MLRSLVVDGLVAALAREDVERSADGTTWWLDTLAQRITIR